MLILFSTNLRDRNINITFKNSYKNTIINVKATGRIIDDVLFYYFVHC